MRASQPEWPACPQADNPSQEARAQKWRMACQEAEARARITPRLGPAFILVTPIKSGPPSTRSHCSRHPLGVVQTRTNCLKDNGEMHLGMSIIAKDDCAGRRTWFGCARVLRNSVCRRNLTQGIVLMTHVPLYMLATYLVVATSMTAAGDEPQAADRGSQGDESASGRVHVRWHEAIGDRAAGPTRDKGRDREPGRVKLGSERAGFGAGVCKSGTGREEVRQWIRRDAAGGDSAAAHDLAGLGKSSRDADFRYQASPGADSTWRCGPDGQSAARGAIRISSSLQGRVWPTPWWAASRSRCRPRSTEPSRATPTW